MFLKNVNVNGQQCQSDANQLGGCKDSVKQHFARGWGRLLFLKKSSLGLKRPALNFMSYCFSILINSSSKLTGRINALKKDQI